MLRQVLQRPNKLPPKTSYPLTTRTFRLKDRPFFKFSLSQRHFSRIHPQFPNQFKSAFQKNATTIRLKNLSRTFATNPWDEVPHSKVGLPALSPSMERGNIVSWNKKEGDRIEPGQIIATIETDKATVDFEATDEAYLAKILFPGGSKDIPVGETIAITVEDQGSVEKFKNFKLDAKVEKTPEAPTKPVEKGSDTKKEEKEPEKAQPKKTQVSDKPPVPTTTLMLPALSPSMETGNIVSWNKKVGDKISSGDVIAEIETDKATVAFEATDDGFLAKVIVEAGTKGIPVGQPIALVVQNKEDIDKLKDWSPASQSSPSEPAPSEPTPKTEEKESPKAATKEVARTTSGDGRVAVSPYARSIAKERGIDLSQVKGTGPNQRIIAADILEFKAQEKVSTPQPTKAAPKQVAPSADQDFTDISVSNIRRVIAERLSLSKQTIPHYYLSIECNVDSLLQLRQQLNNESKGEYKLSINDFIVKAAALALKKVPEANSEWRNDVIRRYTNVHINVAANTDKGLFTPLIQNADTLGLSAISQKTKELATKAKEGKISLDEIKPGTFTISNLGMFGIKQFAAVIYPPQACILAVGGTEKRLVLGDGPDKLVQHQEVMTFTLSCDHRVVDGAVGANWLKVFKDYIENPIKMLL
eukprot:TRINITY_DN4997_c0_g6_i1.p1 TRINITY_DN4997_c0_g6~~TRINITY_DN4997_c0_g6_i1.p1  ORF type:complete len:670 (-),score=189.19 TRINITY_DN4997_c0_g6_i1:113-2041(-)